MPLTPVERSLEAARELVVSQALTNALTPAAIHRGEIDLGGDLPVEKSPWLNRLDLLFSGIMALSLMPHTVPQSYSQLFLTVASASVTFWILRGSIREVFEPKLPENRFTSFYLQPRLLNFFRAFSLGLGVCVPYFVDHPQSSFAKGMDPLNSSTANSIVGSLVCSGCITLVCELPFFYIKLFGNAQQKGALDYQRRVHAFVKVSKAGNLRDYAQLLKNLPANTSRPFLARQGLTKTDLEEYLGV